jgi:hypothetical protein
MLRTNLGGKELQKINAGKVTKMRKFSVRYRSSRYHPVSESRALI